METARELARFVRRSASWVLAGVLILGPVAPASAQSAKTPEQEIEALVTEYTRLEDAIDMATQYKMIAPDRWWHGAGGRRSDNAVLSQIQQANFDATAKRYPGLRTVRDVRDLKIKLIAPTVALASFIWFPNRLIPGDMPPEKVQALGLPPIPQVVSLVWARQADGWKIVSSHISPQYTR